jgi:DNA-directed RNA polymerase beta subunit
MTKNKPLERINFGQIKDAIDIPHLIEVQMKSYSDFLQSGSGKFKSGVEGTGSGLS